MIPEQRSSIEPNPSVPCLFPTGGIRSIVQSRARHKAWSQDIGNRALRVPAVAVLLLALAFPLRSAAQTQTERNEPLVADTSGKAHTPDLPRQGKSVSEAITVMTGLEQDSVRIPGDTAINVTLSTYEYVVGDTSESVSFRLYVRNNSDSLVVIERVEPSCGCILATLQKSFAYRGHDGEIYIGLMTSRMSDYQPFTVDVYTSVNRDSPLRLYIRKYPEHTGDR